jgi:sec-independent protein translocase protein TatA
MLRQMGLPELAIILAIVIILFGVGRVSKIGSELGTAIREFRKGLSEGMEDEEGEDKA